MDGLCLADLSTTAKEAFTRLDVFKTQELSNVVWASTRLSVNRNQHFNAVTRYVTANLDNFQLQELSNLLWAYAASNVDDSGIFQCIAEEAYMKMTFATA